jgi:hypothetical protein
VAADSETLLNAGGCDTPLCGAASEVLSREEWLAKYGEGQTTCNERADRAGDLGHPARWELLQCPVFKVFFGGTGGGGG